VAVGVVMVPAHQSATPLIDATVDGEMAWEATMRPDMFLSVFGGRVYFVGRQDGTWSLHSYRYGRGGKEDEWRREGRDSEITTLHALAQRLAR
jgi:hypothetical protein